MGGAAMIVDPGLAPVENRDGVSTLRLSVAGGLTQFGAYVETLAAGARSSDRHWHSAEDELVLVLSGTPVRVENSEAPPHPGDRLCWPSGQSTGHQLQNRSGAEVVYLTLGTRLPRDIIHHPDHDLITHKDGAARRYTYADGRPRSAGERK
ncbi:MAG: hypothetical protein B7Y02_09565 [Rhodobacterales bacterium 17-64-5]|nr:MAG: hypothetical protein B7Y02_09565 [Rhodobacterales bacterium 17-64-5]